MYDAQLNRKCELEESELDFPGEEVREEEYPNLMLVDKTSQTGDKLSSSLSQSDTEKSTSLDSSKEDEEELCFEPLNGIHQPLYIYFKTINRFPLLNEEEEEKLAKHIKENEEGCKKLVVKWKRLFEKEFLKIFSPKKIKELKIKFEKASNALNHFDDLTKLERTRKKAERALKRASKNSTTTQALTEELHKIEAAISKCIAGINLNKTSINKIIRGLKKIPHSKKLTKKQLLVEKELRSVLREIGRVSKDIKALKNKLVQANLRLVIRIAKKYINYGLTLSDLIQEGNLGLIRAIDTYDYRRGHRFITYACWWIKQAVIRALDCQSKTVRTPVYINEKFNQIVKTSNRLLQKRGREPTLGEIAEATNIPVETLEKVMQSFKDPAVIDTSSEEKSEGALNYSLENETISVLDQVISSNLSQVTDVLLSDLTHREKEIIKLRFGIGNENDHTLEEIGGEFNLSRERIRQILGVALNKLRSPKHIMQLKDFMDFNG
ncbi:MAG: sigma-70 family RNA polymerase sigma factor [Deltaproteobacteria bacterium]|nr:sigma-70 family RNA polymerase sigma factor [Deltaproteobacteria bacterium]